MSQQNTEQPLHTLLRKNPPFRADQVGSLLRPAAVKQARLQRAAGEISAEQPREIENREIIRSVKKQKETGLNVVTDGEFRRAWWHFDFLENLDGVEAFTPESGIQFHNVQTKARGIKVTGDIDFSQHPMLEDYKFLHSIAGDAVPKMTIPSPNMLFFRGKLEKASYQNDYKQFQHDVSKAYKKRFKLSMTPGAATFSSMTPHGPFSYQKRGFVRLKLSARRRMSRASCLPLPLMTPSRIALTI